MTLARLNLAKSLSYWAKCAGLRAVWVSEMSVRAIFTAQAIFLTYVYWRVGQLCSGVCINQQIAAKAI